jgi:hypothetical protein
LAWVQKYARHSPLSSLTNTTRISPAGSHSRILQ